MTNLKHLLRQDEKPVYQHQPFFSVCLHLITPPRLAHSLTQYRLIIEQQTQKTVTEQNF